MNFLKNTIMALFLSSPAAYALDSGIYQQLQDSSCYQVVQVMRDSSQTQLAYVEFAGSCTGSVVLVCDTDFCFGQDEANHLHQLSSVSPTSYLYRIDKALTIYRKL